jgi:hypothetical protein
VAITAEETTRPFSTIGRSAWRRPPTTETPHPLSAQAAPQFVPSVAASHRRHASPPPRLSAAASLRRRVPPPPRPSAAASHRRRVSPPPRLSAAAPPVRRRAAASPGRRLAGPPPRRSADTLDFCKMPGCCFGFLAYWTTGASDIAPNRRP